MNTEVVDPPDSILLSETHRSLPNLPHLVVYLKPHRNFAPSGAIPYQQQAPLRLVERVGSVGKLQALKLDRNLLTSALHPRMREVLDFFESWHDKAEVDKFHGDAQKWQAGELTLQAEVQKLDRLLTSALHLRSREQLDLALRDLDELEVIPAEVFSVVDDMEGC